MTTPCAGLYLSRMKTNSRLNSGKSVSIRDWAEADRPRERWQAQGKKQLSDAELLAILLGSGFKGTSALGLAQQILFNYQQDLQVLGQADLASLSQIKGVGPAKAIQIAAAFELGARRFTQPVTPKPVIQSSADVAQHLKWRLWDLPHEEFWIMLLNRANAVLTSLCISRGGLTGTLADTRLIFRSAMEYRATAIVLAHNHPSGALIPSEADKKLTKKLWEAGKILDIEVVDHLIFGGNHYYSFCDEGLL